MSGLLLHAALATAPPPLLNPLLSNFRVVSVGASQPGNVGMIARACANFECPQFALVAPEYDRADDESGSFERRFAVQEAALTLLRDAPTHASLDAALDGCSVAVGFTRRRGVARSASALQVAPSELAALAAGGARVAFVFGREASGLESSELARCSHHCEIATSAVQGSLSLPQAVLYALGRTFEEALAADPAAAARSLGGDVTSPTAARLGGDDAPSSLQPATVDEVEALVQRCAQLAGDDAVAAAGAGDGWVRTSRGKRPPPGAGPVLVLRRLLQRARPSGRELRAMHSLLPPKAREASPPPPPPPPPRAPPRAPPPRMQLSERRERVRVSLTKPLGIVLEELEEGEAGVVVADLVDGGAAAESGGVRVGDVLLRVDDDDATRLDFDAAMELLVAAPESLELTLSRALPLRGDDDAPIDIVMNLAKALKPDDAVKVDRVVRAARAELRAQLAADPALQAELGELLRLEQIVGAGVQSDGVTVKVRFFGIFSRDDGKSSYSCNISATGVIGDGGVEFTALSCAKDEGWGRTIGVIRDK